MSVIVLSDIHANKIALQAVLDDADAAPEDDIIFCGDLIGYYCWPNDVVDIAQEYGFKSVRGNHDEAVIQDDEYAFGGVAGQALRWTNDRLTEDARDRLSKLPYSRREDYAGTDVYVVHGSPRSPVDEYVYPGAVSERFFDQQGVRPDILLLGHTHIQFAETAGETLVVNPGSVGQPRDEDPDAAYAVIEPGEQDVELHRVEYDIDAVAAAVVENDLPQQMAARLYDGR